jgi:hypothetical protein
VARVVDRSAVLSAASVSSVFRPSTMTALASGDHLAAADCLAPLSSLVAGQPDLTIAEALDIGLEFLGSHYRNEYYFKNAIISKIVFGRHRPTTSSALVELPTRQSIADVVVLNGTSTVYEIKTDLDSFGRLSSQIESYQSCFEHVNVVTSEPRAARALAQTPHYVGVLALRRSGALSVVRQSEGGLDRLRSDKMFEILRQEEAVDLLRRTSNFEIDVAPGYSWARYKDKFLELPRETAHLAFVDQLRCRGMRASGLVCHGDFPHSLRALAFGSHLSGPRRRSLLETLAMPINKPEAAA